MRWMILAGVLAIPAEGADVLVSGNSMGEELPGVLQNLPQHTFTFVTQEQIATIDKAPYEMIWLDGFSDFPNLASAGLDGFVQAGGTLLVEGIGFGSQALTEFPAGGQLVQEYTADAGGEAAVRILAMSHPIMSGLTDAGLSRGGSRPAAIGRFTTLGSFTGLADNGTAGQWVTVTSPLGQGTLVYTDQEFSRNLRDLGVNSEGLRFIDNVASVPEPSVMGLGLVGMMLLWRRARRS